MAKWAIGFDPGKDKCGLAVQNGTGQIIWHGVIPATDVLTEIAKLVDAYPIADLVIGDQTTSQVWRSRLGQHFPGLNIHPVDEKFTSQLARSRYWLMYPPQGWQRLVPKGMRTPPGAIDDLVAIILLERWS